MSNQAQETNRFLVRFAATNLFQYIMDTEDLSVGRGASSQLDHFVQTIECSLRAENLHPEPVYAGASEALFAFANHPEATRAVACIEDTLKEELRFATGIALWEEWKADEALSVCLDRLETKLRREQLRRGTVVPPESPNGERECELDGVRPAEEEVKHAEGRKQVSAHTAQRRTCGRTLRTGYLTRIFGENRLAGIDGDKWRQSFEDLEVLNGEPDTVKTTVHGKMCVIHADGNKFGTCRSQVSSLRGLRQFSQVVEGSMAATLNQALAELFDLGVRHQILPFHLLYWAGDELSVVIPARFGCEIVCTLLSQFSEKILTELNADSGHLRNAIGMTPLTLAVGAVFCDTHEPIQRAERLAKALAEEAKKSVTCARDAQQGNVVEYAVIESGFLPATVDDYLARARSCTWKKHAGSREGILRDSALRGDEFKQLIADVRELKRLAFPGTRVHSFAATVRGATDEGALRSECWSLFQRVPREVDLPDRLRPGSEAACVPCGPFVKPWLDRRELWDYVLPPSAAPSTSDN
jgi:hypothetical protein